MGGYLGRFDFWRRPGLSAFFAVRPISCAQMVGDKLVSAALAAVGMLAWCILIAVFGFNLLGEGLRDALDPHEA